MSITICNRYIDDCTNPLVIAEVGINHGGDFDKAVQMIHDAKNAGCECVKFQCHVVDDEMIYNEIVPANATETIWNMMKRCSFNKEQDVRLKQIVEDYGMIYLCTPFSRAAADRLESLNVGAYKIGSGECNNYPLVKHIASFKKPVILSTGMNNIASIKASIQMLEGCQVAIMQCTSMYPTPYAKVNLNGILEIKEEFPNHVVGLSDHSLENYTCYGAVALGARILEKHYTSSMDWSGPDIPISVTPDKLHELITGCNAIREAMGKGKNILKEEQPTIDFAYASVVSTKNIKTGDTFDKNNTWVKRPGTGQIHAKFYEQILGKAASCDIAKNEQIKWTDIT